MPYLFIVDNIVHLEISFDFNTELQSGVEIVNQLLGCFRYDRKVIGDVASVNTCLQSFDVPSDVCLTLEQVAIKHLAKRFHVLVGHNDVSLVGFDLFHFE